MTLYFNIDSHYPFKFYRLLVVQLEKKEAMREEEEKKRKALKRRTLKDQVNKSSSIRIHNLTLYLVQEA